MIYNGKRLYNEYRDTHNEEDEGCACHVCRQMYGPYKRISRPKQVEVAVAYRTGGEVKSYETAYECDVLQLQVFRTENKLLGNFYRYEAERMETCLRCGIKIPEWNNQICDMCFHSAPRKNI